MSFEGPGIPKQVIPASQFGPLPIGANLAFLGAASANQSSTANGGDAGRAVDGDTDGDFSNGSVTHTANELQPWWEIDLGAVYPLDSIRLWNRTDCCGSRLSDFHVLVSDLPFVSQGPRDDPGPARRGGHPVPPVRRTTTR